ncbi:MAG: protein translocase subunit SecF, partial [Acidimicrobiia bacterium]
ALFIGIALGTYSSIFVAAPLLAIWKEREPDWQTASKRAERRRRDGGPDAPAEAVVEATPVEAAPSAPAGPSGATARAPRKRKKRR